MTYSHGVLNGLLGWLAGGFSTSTRVIVGVSCPDRFPLRASLTSCFAGLTEGAASTGGSPIGGRFPCGAPPEGGCPGTPSGGTMGGEPVPSKEA